MIQVQQIQIRKTKNPEVWGKLDLLCYYSKNLYNQGLYRVRQEFIANGTYKSYPTLCKELANENNVDYRALLSKVSQQVLRRLDQNFKSFFQSIKDYGNNPKKYLGRPKLPKYKDKVIGRFPVIYTYQAISKRDFEKSRKITLSGTGISMKVDFLPSTIAFSDICEVRVIPKPSSTYVIEIVYEIPDTPQKPDNGRYCSIDLGLGNLCTLSGNTGDTPLIINGRPLKSINHYYNKRKAYYQSKLKKGVYTSKRIKKITEKRGNKIKDYLHKASTKVVNYLVSKNISKLVIGYNKGWKQNINLGKKVNQGFTGIPYYTLLGLFKYKCEKVGIEYLEREESYTSVCSFLDQEDIRKHNVYMGKRKKRGLFESSGGLQINADVNGSLNILRKAFPRCFDGIIKTKGIQGFVVSPVIINITK